MAFTETWDETVPIDHSKFSTQPGHVRDLKTAVRERLQFGGMYFPDTDNALAGEHTYARFAQTTAPSAVASKWHVYFTASGMFVRTPAGVDIQICSTTELSQSFVTGDWITSTVTTAHTGWTNVSSTYANKFIRISTSGLSTGGSDTHDHGFTYAHTHTITTTNSITGTSGSPVNTAQHDTYTTGSQNTSAGTTASGDNVPVYVTAVLFQKN